MPLPERRARILRVFKQAIGVALFVRRAIGKHPRQQACHGIYHHHRRQFAPGQHIVPDTQLIGNEGSTDTFIYAFVVPTHQHQTGQCRQLCRVLLRKRHPIGREQHDRWRTVGIVGNREHPPDSRRQWHRLHHHTCPAPIGVIVGGLVFVGGIRPDIVQPDRQAMRLLCPLQDAFGQRTVKHGGK